jgi:hypothetical protein
MIGLTVKTNIRIIRRGLRGFRQARASSLRAKAPDMSMFTTLQWTIASDACFPGYFNTSQHPVSWFSRMPSPESKHRAPVPALAVRLSVERSRQFPIQESLKPESVLCMKSRVLSMLFVLFPKTKVLLNIQCTHTGM